MWFYLYDLLLPGLVSTGARHNGTTTDDVAGLRVPLSVYWHLAVALAVASVPLIVGLVVRRCRCFSTVRRNLGPCPSSPSMIVGPEVADSPSPPPLPPPRSTPPTALDRAVYPVCLLAVVVAGVITSYRVWAVKNTFDTWQLLIGLLPAAAFLPAASFVVGAAGVVHAQGLARAKSAGLAVALTGATALASSAIDVNNGDPDAALIAANATVFELVAILFAGLLFAVHLASWAVSSRYRDAHGDDAAVPWAVSGFFYRSIAERIVRSMIKAGEITFRRHAGTATSPRMKPQHIRDHSRRGRDDGSCGGSGGKRLSSVSIKSSVR